MEAGGYVWQNNLGGFVIEAKFSSLRDEPHWLRNAPQ